MDRRTDKRYNIIDGYTGATPLSLCALGEPGRNPFVSCDMFVGTIPGSVGETSTVAILIGALILIVTGIGSWKIIVSVFAGGLAYGIAFFNALPANPYMQLPFYYHFVMGDCFRCRFHGN